MIRGFYTAASGLISAARRMEVVTNNLANAQTTGFKQERTGASAFDQQLVMQLALGGDPAQVGPLMLSDQASEPELDFTQGALRATERDLDLAIEGPAFFAVRTADGIRYTRDGSFTRGAQGMLLTQTGGLVLGENGPLEVPPGRLDIRTDGTVLVDEAPVGKLRLVEFRPDQTLKRVGDNQFAPRDEGVQPALSSGSVVHHRFLEGSNVDLTATLTTSIELQRAYEANQRMMQYQDELMARAANDIARPTN